MECEKWGLPAMESRGAAAASAASSTILAILAMFKTLWEAA